MHLRNVGDYATSAILNNPRSEALRGSPLDSWIALSEGETRVIATGATYEEVAKQLDDGGDKDSVILKTPKSWLPLAV
jgi:hypothetical protein